LRGRRDVEFGLIVAPRARSNPTGEQQQCNSTEQRPSVKATTPSRNARERNNTIGFGTTPLLNSFIFRPHMNLCHFGTSSNTPW
jgi:hypothetical protein